jgi:multimeric flavodoxin WrbA
MMRIVAFNGSPRTNGNTSRALDHLLAPLRNVASVERIELGAEKLSPCNACLACQRNRDSKCILKKDALNDLLKKMVSADCIVIASPVYFAGVTPQVKALIDRVGLVSTVNGGMLRNKLGVSLVVEARSGGIAALDQIDHFFLAQNMVMVGSDGWNVLKGREPGDVDGDRTGLENLSNLAANMAWLLERLTR